MNKTQIHKSLLNSGFDLEVIGNVNRFTANHQASKVIHVDGIAFKHSGGENFLFIVDEIYHGQWKYKFCIVGMESSRVVHSDVYTEKEFGLKLQTFFQKLS